MRASSPAIARRVEVPVEAMQRLRQVRDALDERLHGGHDVGQQCAIRLRELSEDVEDGGAIFRGATDRCAVRTLEDGPRRELPQLP